jgi:hypothetical protein
VNSTPEAHHILAGCPKAPSRRDRREYGRRVPGRTAPTLLIPTLLISTLLISTLSTLGLLTGTAAAVADEPPTVGTPSVATTSAASVSVSVPVDSHGNATTVMVEYVTAGAYRGAERDPSAATTVTIATIPPSDAGPVPVTGQVTGLDPGSAYLMRVKAVNARGEALSTDVTVTTPAAPRIAFRAKVGADATRLTRLILTRLTGGESATVRRRTAARGCPFTRRTVDGLAAGKRSLSSLLKGDALDPGAKVIVRVIAYGTRLSTLTLIIRDGRQPKVRRG